MGLLDAPKKERRQNWEIWTTGTQRLYQLFRHGVTIPFERVERRVQAYDDDKPVRWEWHFIRKKYIVAILDNRCKFVGPKHDIENLDDPPNRSMCDSCKTLNCDRKPISYPGEDCVNYSCRV